MSTELLAVYRKHSPGQHATADGYGSGSCSGEGPRQLVGIATDRKNASEIILVDAYQLSGANVYSAVVSEIRNYENGVDTVGFTQSTSWTVEPITVNMLLPEFAPKIQNFIEVSNTA
jgi:hypothetical protein